jgi:hypothetical protein
MAVAAVRALTEVLKISSGMLLVSPTQWPLDGTGSDLIDLMHTCMDRSLVRSVGRVYTCTTISHNHDGGAAGAECCVTPIASVLVVDQRHIWLRAILTLCHSNL